MQIFGRKWRVFAARYLMLNQLRASVFVQLCILISVKK